MTLRDAHRIPTVAALGLAMAMTAAPATADDPPAAQGRSAQVDAPAAGDLPRADAVLDAMPLFTGAIGEAASGEGALDTPGLGDRPTPAEARRRGEIGETPMRPRGGSATGGKPDVPPER